MARSDAKYHLRRLWLAEGFVLATALIQALVVARALGPDLYGVYALVTAFAAFLFLVLDPRSADAVVRYLAEFNSSGEPDKARAIVRGGLLLDVAWGIGGLMLVSALGYPASRVLHISEHADLIPVVALGLAVVAPAATSRAVLAAFDRFDAISSRQFVVAIVRCLSVCAVALAGLGLSGVIWTLSIVSVIECAIFVTGALSVTQTHLGAGVRGASLGVLRDRRRELVGFLGYSGLTTLAGSAIKHADTLILGAIAGPREAGYYRLAKSLTAPAGNVGVPLQTVLYPRLAGVVSMGDSRRAHEIVKHTFLRGELPLALAALVCLPLVPLGIRVLAGSAFDGAILPAVALVVGVSVSFATLHQRPVFLVRNQMRSLFWFTIAGALATLAAFVPASEVLGATGVAWARTVLLAISSVLMAIYLRSTRLPRVGGLR